MCTPGRGACARSWHHWCYLEVIGFFPPGATCSPPGGASGRGSARAAQVAALEGEAAAARAGEALAGRRVRGAAAGRLADLEAEAGRQAGALGALAAAAGALAEENAALDGELAGARCAQADAAQSVGHLEVRGSPCL